jgi:hypothetical protein
MFPDEIGIKTLQNIVFNTFFCAGWGVPEVPSSYSVSELVFVDVPMCTIDKVQKFMILREASSRIAIPLPTRQLVRPDKVALFLQVPNH